MLTRQRYRILERIAVANFRLRHRVTVRFTDVRRQQEEKTVVSSTLWVFTKQEKKVQMKKAMVFTYSTVHVWSVITLHEFVPCRTCRYDKLCRTKTKNEIFPPFQNILSAYTT